MASVARALQVFGVALIVVALVAAGGAFALDAHRDCESGEGIFVTHYDESATHTDAPRVSVDELPEAQREAFLEAVESGSLPEMVEAPPPEEQVRIVTYEGERYEVSGPLAWDCDPTLIVIAHLMVLPALIGLAIAGASTAWRRFR